MIMATIKKIYLDKVTYDVGANAENITYGSGNVETAIANLEGAVETTTSNVEANAKNIATNTENITANTTSIATITTALETKADKDHTHSIDDVADLTDKLQTLVNNDETLQKNIDSAVKEIDKQIDELDSKKADNTTIVELSGDVTIDELAVNAFYKITACTSLTITAFAAGTAADEYLLDLRTGDSVSVTLPSVVWAGDDEPDWSANTGYQVSIVNGVAAYLTYEL